MKLKILFCIYVAPFATTYQQFKKQFMKARFVVGSNYKSRPIYELPDRDIILHKL